MAGIRDKLIHHYFGVNLEIVWTMTSIEEKIDLEKIVNATLKEISSIEAIYLFGSIAKGKENERSDYDIAVIVREYPEKDLDKIARIRPALEGALFHGDLPLPAGIRKIGKSMSLAS